jgi:hypothetical protein
MQTFIPLIKYISNLSVRRKVQIYQELDMHDFLNVFKLPGGHIELFFNEQVISLEVNKIFNPI